MLKVANIMSRNNCIALYIVTTGNITTICTSHYSTLMYIVV